MESFKELREIQVKQAQISRDSMVSFLMEKGLVERANTLKKEDPNIRAMKSTLKFSLPFCL